MLRCWTNRSSGRIRHWIVFLSVSAVVTVSGQAAELNGLSDPVFAHVPFDKWVADGGQPQIHWTVNVSKPRLSAHQRLEARIEAHVDEKELAKRRGKGGLVMLVQLKDSEDRAYQTHALLDLRNMKDTDSGSEALFSLDAMIVPGTYALTLIAFDTSSGDHSVVKRSLRVDALPNDPLPQAWKDLPPVEFAPVVEAPDSWFLPPVMGRLHLPVESKQPVHIDLVMNASPPDDGDNPKTGVASNSNLAVLVPAVKALSQLGVGQGSLNVSVLDLMRRKTPLDQKVEGQLDWTPLKAAIEEANPNVIDVRSLEHREQNAQFFISEVARKIAADSSAEESGSKDPRVLIVLSGPMAFHSGADMHAIEASAPKNTRVFYFRYHSFMPTLPVPTPENFGMRQRRGLGPGDPPIQPRAAHEPPDSLERTLRPLQPQLFDVWNPEEFRKALGKMLEEISRM